MILHTLFAMIYRGATCDDLDEAVRPIQETLGQTDGGLASLFFSGANEVAWPTGSFEWRQVILRAYAKFELDNMTLRQPQPPL